MFVLCIYQTSELGFPLSQWHLKLTIYTVGKLCAKMICNVVYADVIAMRCFGICFSVGKYRGIFTFVVVNICSNYMTYKIDIFVHLLLVKLQTKVDFSLEELLICFRLTDRIDLFDD